MTGSSALLEGDITVISNKVGKDVVGGCGFIAVVSAAYAIMVGFVALVIVFDVVVVVVPSADVMVVVMDAATFLFFLLLLLEDVLHFFCENKEESIGFSL